MHKYFEVWHDGAFVTGHTSEKEAQKVKAKFKGATIRKKKRIPYLGNDRKDFPIQGLMYPKKK